MDDPFQDQPEPQQEQPTVQLKPARAAPLPPHITQRLFQPEVPVTDPFRDNDSIKSNVTATRRLHERRQQSEIIDGRQINTPADILLRRRGSESPFTSNDSPTKSTTASFGSQNPFDDQDDIDRYSSSSSDSPQSSVFPIPRRPTTLSVQNSLMPLEGMEENPFEQGAISPPTPMPRTVSAVTGPPPLPERPATTNVNNISGLLSTKLVLKPIDDAKIPDTASAYRSPPIANYLPVNEITLKGHSKISSFSGYYAVTGTSNLRSWHIPYGENKHSIHLSNEEKLQCASFVRTNHVSKDGQICWIALDKGEIIQFNSQSGEIEYRSFAHMAPVKIILKGKKCMYTIDENGGLKIWEISQELGIVDLKGKSKSLRIQPRQLFAIVVENRLWTASLKSIDIYDLSADSQSFSCKKIEVGMGIGAITGITFLDRRQEIITSHECGKVTVYNAQNYERMYYVQLSSYKILSILAVGEAMVWVGFGTGKIIIYRINEKANWRAILDFPAYVNSGVVTLELDDTSLINTGNLTIMSLSDGGTVKFWNGLLTEYYKDIAIKAKCDEYCTYTPLNLLILTYNIDSRKPENMDESGHDSSLLAEFLATHDADLYVFGFQELVDLENKSVSAKSFLRGGSKKISKTDDSKMAQRMRLWQDRLVQMLPPTFTIIKTTQLVGLFQCIIFRNNFVIRELAVDLVKTGLGGYHGNKVVKVNEGAIISRFLIGDSSICFVNSHLAAHQSHTSARNNDIQQILKETNFAKINSGHHWEKGGDGSSILDHEFIFWSGDLNYRIDLRREQVAIAARDGNFTYLWKYDQLLNQQQRNPSFGLRKFIEAPLNFGPTFKYDRGTDYFDTSEKLRIPAYCDRILYRGKKVSQHSYNRLELKMSDHRPVFAEYKILVKRIDPSKYELYEQAANERISNEKQQSIRNASIAWLMDTHDYTFEAAQNWLDEHGGRLA